MEVKLTLKYIIWWGGGSRTLFAFYILGNLVLHANFWNLRASPSGRKEAGSEKRKKENNTVTSNHFVLLAMP